MTFDRLAVIRAVILVTVATFGATSRAADRAALVKRLEADIACPQPPVVVDGAPRQYIESYGGDDNVFRLNRDVKFTRVDDGVNVNDYYFETVTFRFSDLDTIESHEEDVGVACKSGTTCIANTSTRPRGERPPPAIHETKLRACDRRTAEDIKGVLEALRADE